LHRFHLGAGRASDADAVLDFTIALESLLLPYDEETRRSELSYRFRLHGAHYLSDSVTDRPTISSQLRSIYDMRSRLVHGNNYPNVIEVRNTRMIADEFARRGLLKAVTHGFPSADLFRGLALGVV
jgi:hypothetical protein